MAKKKFYAVRNGRKNGIFLTWEDCKEQVEGFPGAEYKGFSSLSEAGAYLEGTEKTEVKSTPKADESVMSKPDNESTLKRKSAYNMGMYSSNQPYAFVDGSFNSETNTYGFGGYLVDTDGMAYVLQGSDNKPDMASMRNVAGELLGSLEAIKVAQKLKIKELTMYYDYAGIENWVTGDWKCNKEGTRQYRETVLDAMDNGLKINFEKVKGHSGIEGNELADKLAKIAVGLEPARKMPDISGMVMVDDKSFDCELE